MKSLSTTATALFFFLLLNLFADSVLANPPNSTRRMLFFSANIYIHNINPENKKHLLNSAEEEVRKSASKKLSQFLQNAFPETADNVFFPAANGFDNIQILAFETFDASEIGPDITGVYFFGRSSFELSGEIPPPLIGINISSDKQQYVLDDELHFSINANRDANICFIYITGDGEVTQLLPNSLTPQSHFPPGRHSFPEHGKYSFTAQDPIGVDQLILFASDVPIGEIVESGEEYRYFAQTNSNREKISSMFHGRVLDHLKKTGPGSRFSVVQFIETSRDIEILQK